MDWGEHSEWLTQMARDDGEVPKALAERPALPPHLDMVWQGFWALSGDRSFGMGAAGPIPFTAVDRYAARYGIDDIDEFERFHRLVKALDSAWIEKINKRTEGE